ncbi:hypothetical protein ANN_07227 [Periplaneta americana]|uniref:Uncharacterized protein n=1 Tax=Periplaneta americana TaxID=6978 RepID=A0ABQ8TGC6_PERAM|nr:hypothetical protein ANN_07227 [Periplaneta americana]
MSPGSSTESYPAFAHIGLRENPGKTSNQVTCPNQESNPGHLVSQPDALTVTPQTFEMGRALAHMGESRNAYRVLVGRPEGKRPLRIPRRSWEDNIKMDLREAGYDCREGLCEGGNEPPGSLKASKEIHVPAYGEAMFQVKLVPIVRDKDITENVHLSAVAIGYIRIAEAYREEEGQFIRPWGSNLQPVQLVLDAVIETPLLTMDLVSANLKLRVDVPTIMGAPDGTYTEQWTLTYSNETQSTLSAQVDTRKPFKVVRITTLDCRGNRLVYDNFMVLESQQCAEVTVKCSLDVKDVEYGLYIWEGDSPENPLVKSVTLKRDLVFTQKPSRVKQTVPLQVKMVYPSLNINTMHIDFSAVYVSNSKSFCLQVSNNSVNYSETGLNLTSDTNKAPRMSQLDQEIMGKSKDYKEILEIKACVPGEWPKVNLVGVGTLNERFKVSGC